PSPGRRSEVEHETRFSETPNLRTGNGYPACLQGQPRRILAGRSRGKGPCVAARVRSERAAVRGITKSPLHQAEGSSESERRSLSSRTECCHRAEEGRRHSRRREVLRIPRPGRAVQATGLTQ